MMERTQISLPAELQRRARARAAEFGISFAEYVRRVVARDLGEQAATRERALLFDLGDSGGSNVARDKHRLVGEAVDAGRR